MVVFLHFTRIVQHGPKPILPDRNHRIDEECEMCFSPCGVFFLTPAYSGLEAEQSWKFLQKKGLQGL